MIKKIEDGVSLISEKGNRIINLQELMDLHGIDNDLWEVVRQTANVWEQAQNKKDWTTEIIQLHQVKADFKPVSELVKPEIRSILKKVFSDIIPVQKREEYHWGDLLVNINLADTHLWRINQGSPKKYLKSIGDRVYSLFDKALKDKPDKVLLWQLGDFYDAEMNGKTTSGKHEQQLSMKATDMFREWLQFHIDLVNTLSSELPTDVIINHWNHDRNILFQTGEALDLYFAKTNNVSIDNWVAPRKYYEWGKTKLWFSHGDWEKEKDLLKTFSAETKLGKNNYHTRGHFHEASVKQFGPLEVETLASTAEQSDRERNKFADKPWKIVAKEYDKKDWLYKKIFW